MNRKGQAMTEYLLLTIIAILMATVLWRSRPFNNALNVYYNRIASDVANGIRF